MVFENKDEYDLNTIFNMLREQFDKDLKDPYIHKPYSHTLFTVWKKMDTKERPRLTDVDDWTWKRTGNRARHDMEQADKGSTESVNAGDLI